MYVHKAACVEHVPMDMVPCVASSRSGSDIWLQQKSVCCDCIVDV